MGDSTARLIYIIFGKIFHLLCLYLILTLTKARFDTRVFLRSLPLLSCQILSIYICQKNFALVIAGNAPSILRLETLGLLYINLVICAFVEMLNRSHEREREAENARRQLELQENYYADLMARQEETRSLWHDMKKYMASVEALIANENREEAQRCLEGIHSAFSELSSAVDTGNKLVDSILTYGIKRAREHGVSVRPDIWVDNNLAFPATDLFVIIGNTLDNAIEACAQLDDAAERVITVTLRQNNHLLLYEISNPYVDKNTRKPGKIHGYGLKNVRACVERNEGLLQISKQDNIFRVSIQLNIGEK
ncbi:MAG: GHKL domain-containing protein [Oscillospiraceae bacterium]|nr:GHKL domain-containing protein [Oscillospiraceae bacterium]